MSAMRKALIRNQSTDNDFIATLISLRSHGPAQHKFLNSLISVRFGLVRTVNEVMSVSDQRLRIPLSILFLFIGPPII